MPTCGNRHNEVRRKKLIWGKAGKPKESKKNKKTNKKQENQEDLLGQSASDIGLFFFVFFCFFRPQGKDAESWVFSCPKGRPNFRFSGGGGSVCVVFFWARNTTIFSKEWTNIIYCILFKETCIKACCIVVSERATAYWRIPVQNNAIFPARNTILLQMAIPCIALYYRHITLFQRDCCIYERVSLCTTTYCKSHHTQPYSFTRTAVCLEGYFSKRCYILLKGILCVTVYI